MRADADPTAEAEAHLELIKHACPSIATLVWWPSGYHCHLAISLKSRVRFRQALRRYTEGIFAVWPTLVRFERLKLENEPPSNRFRVFVRDADGGVSDSPGDYDEGLWSLV